MHKIPFARNNEAESCVWNPMEPPKWNTPDPQKPAKITEIRSARAKRAEACIGQAQKVSGPPMPTPKRCYSDAQKVVKKQGKTDPSTFKVGDLFANQFFKDVLNEITIFALCQYPLRPLNHIKFGYE